MLPWKKAAQKPLITEMKAKSLPLLKSTDPGPERCGVRPWLQINLPSGFSGWHPGTSGGPMVKTNWQGSCSGAVTPELLAGSPPFPAFEEDCER
jgi:hypothetical protein